MTTTHNSGCSVRSAISSSFSSSTTTTNKTGPRRKTTITMSVNFILEVKRVDGTNGAEVIQRKLPTQIVIPSSSSSGGQDEEDDPPITLETVLQSLAESQTPLYLWNTDQVEFAYKVKLEDQFNINTNTWAVPLTGVPLQRVVNVEEDCIVVRPVPSSAVADKVPSDVQIPTVSASSTAVVPTSATSSLTSAINNSDVEGEESSVSSFRDGKEDFRTYREIDVLIGDNVGDLLKNHPGNKRFRPIVRRHKRELLQMKTSGAVELGSANFDKILNDIGASIIDEIKVNGARFMFKKGRDSWVVSGDKRVLQMIIDHLTEAFDDTKNPDATSPPNNRHLSVANPFAVAESPMSAKAGAKIKSDNGIQQTEAKNMANARTQKPSPKRKATSNGATSVKKVRNKVAVAAKSATMKKPATHKKSSTPKVASVAKAARRATPGKYQRFAAVGKKFRIKCGKDKYHQGRVVAYDRSTGKHTVQYGPAGETWPERVLNLSRNTIIWD